MGPNRRGVGSLGLSRGEFITHLFRNCLSATNIPPTESKVKELPTPHIDSNYQLDDHSMKRCTSSSKRMWDCRSSGVAFSGDCRMALVCCIWAIDRYRRSP